MARAIGGALAAGAGFFLARKYLLHHLSPQDQKRYQRQNFHGETVSLAGGIKVAAACLATGASLAGNRAAQVGTVLPVAAGAALGYLDDTRANLGDNAGNGRDKQPEPLPESSPQAAETEAEKPAAPKGFHGHLQALSEGKVTTGALKIVGIGTGAALGAIGIGRSRRTGLGSWILDTMLIAGSANLANLFDLRPGRCLKVAALASLPLTSSNAVEATLAGGAVATSLLALPADLGEREMLGDTGANALGALLGSAWAQKTGTPGKLVGVLGIVALTAASEKISFSQVITNTPGLRTIDQLGRKR
ncbi:hypothetical protein [Varibaculum cambriense]|uniref:hypothetical protein n=1 Tax=Varibaculum cambriense TaxID=184870 RepID=UPI002554EF70|nr:hypothetical protein [Varibaculum cambriense]MDK8275202.1 hypothetical protein [Varibaculum cambriense]